MRWVRCSGCQHIFTDGYFTDAAFNLLLSSAHRSQTPGHEVAAGRALSAPIIESVLSLTLAQRRQDPGRWLDVGFGSGALLTTAAEFGFSAEGIDVRQECVTRLREFGFSATCADFATFSPDAPYDVISLADVLEHMPFPRAALQRAHALLNPDGLVFLSMPNADAFLFRYLDAMGQNPYWAELEHYHNFGRRRLCALLRETGFTPCRYGISQRYVACMELIARKELP
jgi:SAM-dependent methyltransferase